MSNNFQSKIERSSFGTASAKAARQTVTPQKASKLVQRALATSKAGQKTSAKRDGK